MADVYFAHLTDADKLEDQELVTFDAWRQKIYYRLPGNLLEYYREWYEEVTKQYSDTTVTEYNSKNSEWTTFASYQEPDPTFWNWFFSGWTKKVSDPNKPPT